MKSPSERQRHARTALLSAAEALTLEELHGSAMDALQGALSASNILLYRFDERGALGGVAGRMLPSLPDYSYDLFLEDPVQRLLYGLSGSQQVLHTIHGLDEKVFHRSAAYADFYSRYDIEHLLGVWLTRQRYGEPGMTGVLLTRSKNEPDFDEEDRRVLDEVLGAFEAAVRRSRRVGDMQRDAEVASAVAAAGGGASIAFDARGALLWMSPEAERLFHTSRGGRGLPEALVGAARKLGRVANGETSGGPPRFSLSIATQNGARADAELLIARRAQGEPFVAVTVRPHGASEVSLDAAAHTYHLTRAERSVLSCLAEGDSNKAIAAKLFVSIETVKTHVQRLLTKLGVTSRTQAALVALKGA